MSYKLYHGDCLDVARDEIAGGSVDLVLTDFPYGTTQCSWDTIIPFVPMWEQIKRVRKPRAAVVLFGSEPFSSLLRVSNMGEYKYDWVWEKDKATNHLNAKIMPMKKVEMISVFNAHLYNPQLSNKKAKDIRSATKKRKQVENYGSMTADSVREISITKSYPNEILKFRGCFGDAGKSFHPTQKPVALLRYLIRTYTNAGDTVLDFTMGSGSTGVAAILEGRNFIGIDNGHCEKEGLYHGWRWVDVARERIANAANEFTPTAKEKASGQMALWGGD